MARVFLVRHGNTFAEGEPPRRIGTRTDLPLVASGIAQAEALGRWFAAHDVRFVRALAGGLKRTQATAALLIAHTAAPPAIETAQWLSEIDHGPDEDRDDATVQARIGHEALMDWDARGVAPPGWIVDAPTRIAAWRALFAQRWQGDMLLVTSNGAVRFALLAEAELMAAFSGPLKLRTGAFAEIRRDDAGALGLTKWDFRPEEAGS